MSGATTTSTAPTVPTAEPSEVNSLRNPTFILACFSYVIVAATVGAVFYRGNDSAINVVLGFVLGSMGAGVVSFYFGSSKSSQAKDENTSGTTVVTTTPTTTRTAP
jgi:hypothetical protein